MSIYCYLICNDCKERIHVKDADTFVDAPPKDHGDFLEKHFEHSLEFIWEDDERSYEFSKFQPCGAEEYWRRGRLIIDD